MSRRSLSIAIVFLLVGALHAPPGFAAEGVLNVVTGNLDRVVKRKLADDFGRGIRKLCQASSKLRAGCPLNIFDKLPHNIVEKLDLILGEPSRPNDE